MVGSGSSPVLILASASPRRKDLLAQIGIIPDKIQPADLDESEKPSEVPRIYALRLAIEKAQWSDIQFSDLDEDDLIGVSVEALRWTNGVIQSL